VVEPVKKEWIIGKALFAVPLIGYLPLHLVEFAILVIVIVIIHDLVFVRWKRKDE